MSDNKRKTISFFAFNLGNAINLSKGGTGVFIRSIEKIFREYHLKEKIILNTMEFGSLDNQCCSKIYRFILTFLFFLKQILMLYRDRSDFIILVYPKIPIVAMTNNPEFLILALLAYFPFLIKMRLSKRILAIIIEDIPVEQAETTGSVINPFSKILITTLEKILFISADLLLSPSRLMSDYIDKKYKLSNDWIIYHRDMYLHLDDASLEKRIEPEFDKVNVLHSGAIYPVSIEFFIKIVEVFEKSEKGILYICGMDLNWLANHIKKHNLNRIKYVGVLNYLEHDYLASHCDFGLIIYPQHSYCDFKPTTKYSAYLANGLPILSLNLTTIKNLIEEDKCGLAVDESVFLQELHNWLSNKQNFNQYREAALMMSKRIQNADFMKAWIDDLIAFNKEIKWYSKQ